MATILLIAPSTYHRILFRRGEKRQLLEAGNRFTISGTVFLALAMCASIYVITDALFQLPTAVAVSVASLVAFTGVWYLVPIWRRLRGPPRSH